MPALATPLRDPTAELNPLLRERRTPPDSLDGKTIALLDIGKARSREFLDRLEQQFHTQGLLTRPQGCEARLGPRHGRAGPRCQIQGGFN